MTVTTTTSNTSFGDAASDTHVFTGHITASHNISSSGIIIGNVGQFNELEFGAFTNITASGDISTSGAFIGDGSQL